MEDERRHEASPGCYVQQFVVLRRRPIVVLSPPGRHGAPTLARAYSLDWTTACFKLNKGTWEPGYDG